MHPSIHQSGVQSVPDVESTHKLVLRERQNTGCLHMSALTLEDVNQSHLLLEGCHQLGPLSLQFATLHRESLSLLSLCTPPVSVCSPGFLQLCLQTFILFRQAIQTRLLSDPFGLCFSPLSLLTLYFGLCIRELLFETRNPQLVCIDGLLCFLRLRVHALFDLLKFLHLVLQLLHLRRRVCQSGARLLALPNGVNQIFFQGQDPSFLETHCVVQLLFLRRFLRMAIRNRYPHVSPDERRAGFSEHQPKCILQLPSRTTRQAVVPLATP
mmetsp:Transcript_49549/g.97577  ORF Transcript_49549/g.97577 Transcript_49549/m.97577 type:complete len:268 (-) Transcript_49549:483-1286(-)